MVAAERYVVWAGRLILAAVFLSAAVGKLSDPQGFARAIWNYRILPGEVVPYLSLFLPALEIVAAAAILVPPLQRGASFILVALLVVFTGALAAAMARGLDVECGCFGEGSSRVSWVLILRNVALGAAALWSFLHAARPSSSPEGGKG